MFSTPLLRYEVFGTRLEPAYLDGRYADLVRALVLHYEAFTEKPWRCLESSLESIPEARDHERRLVAGTEVRERLAGSLPTGHELIEVHDVWLGAPALSGQVVAADYRMNVTILSGAMPDAVALAGGIRRLLAAAALPRTRDKGGRAIPYDLRPLVAGIEVQPNIGARPGDAATEPTPLRAVQLRIRTRFDPERGVGRPEEVLAALSELSGMSLTAQSTTRERLLLAGEE